MKYFLGIILLMSMSLGAEVIIDEDFSGAWPPAGWTTTGGTNWQQGTGNYAGGVAPEARFYWSPSATAVFRLISPIYDTTGGTTLQLSFKHYIDHYSGAYDLKIQTTSDGNNWNDAWILNPTANVGPEVVNVDVNTPDVGSQNFQIAWVFDGYTWNINNWYVDDVFLEGQLVVYDNDLAGITITGNNVVNAGNTENYAVTVKNVGNNPQTNYTVKLFKNNNIELASLDVSNTLQPEQTATHNLVWQIPLDEPQATVNLNGKVILAGDENTNNDNTNQLAVMVFPPGIAEISIGNGTELNNRTPVCFQYLNSLTEMLYFEDELNYMTGMITMVKFNTNFSNQFSKPIKIWMGTTTLETLADGWIPSTQLTTVFDGTVTFLSGANHIVTVELDTPFFYDGDNLVMMVHRPMDTQSYTGSDDFLHTETTDHPNRTRYERDNTMVLDPANPPIGYSFAKLPNTTFTFFMGDMGNVEGYVRDEQNEPLSGAEVLIEDLNMISYTNDVGYYYFGNVLTGIYDFTATKFGYSPQTQQAEVLQDQTIAVDFSLIPLGVVQISGNVVGSDFPGIGLTGAVVSLSGFANYQVLTDNNGDFLFPDVYTNVTYDLEIVKQGYDLYTDQVVVGDVNVDLETIILSEMTTPPGNVVAAQNVEQTEAYLNWNSPGQGGGEFRYDDGEPDFAIGFSTTPANGVFGAVHKKMAIVQEVRWYLTSLYGTHPNVKILILGLDGDDLPDVNQLYHVSALLPNIDDEWNSYILDEQIAAMNGFFVGLITPNLYTSIALDDGVGEPWAFQFGTHFSNENWLAGNDWVDIGSVSPMFQRNMLLRAYGVDLGNTDEIQSFNGIESYSNRVFESYNIYRFLSSQQGNPALWTLVGPAIADTTFTDYSWNSLPLGTYQFAITSVHTNGVESIPAFSNTVQKTIVGNDNELLAANPKLFANNPNPFNPSTTIRFKLNPDLGKSQLMIFNLKGQKIRSYELLPDQSYIIWDGKDDLQRSVSSGVYFYKLINGNFSQTRKMILLK
jgi:hypothetical protein